MTDPRTMATFTGSPVVIDGSQGEGGGQMLRTSLALSAITGRPLRMSRIRARRPKPGLMRQHLTAVQAAAAVCGASVTGAEVGSSEIEFIPGAIVAGEHEFRIGTAGSTTLVLQTVLPILMRAERPSTVVLEGGTHNPFAPTVDFLRGAFLATLSRSGARFGGGPRIDVRCERPGFFPVGGGRVVATIEPAPAPSRLEATVRGAIVARRGCALVSSLPGEIAAREVAVLRQRLGWEESCFRIEEIRADRGPGNVVTVEIEAEHASEVFIGIGERGLSAEKVATRVADAARAWMDADVPVGPHLADQLLLPLALVGAGAFVTVPLTSHSTTNIEVIERFLGPTLRVLEERPGRVRVVAGRQG